MTRYRSPQGMRYSTLEERRGFYQEEFSLRRVEEWFSFDLGSVLFAVVMGRHTGIVLSEYRSEASTTILIEDYEALDDVKDWILEFLPESVYYDRNIYGDGGEVRGQQMVFDIDPENVECPVHGTLGDRMERGQGLSFCKMALEKVRQETVRLYQELNGEFSELRIVYSGRGYHLHILDEASFEWSAERRKRFADSILREGFPIDEWVTSGSMRLIRLPYTLHGMVSRVVTPLSFSELKRFDPLRDSRCIPRFLRL